MSLQIRPATLDDAPGLIGYMKTLSGEQDVDILLEPGEFMASVAEEEDFLRSYLNDDHSLFLVAHYGQGPFVGTLSLDGGRFRSTRHVVNLGISVHKDYRKRGIGRSLMQTAIDWCDRTGSISRIQLQVSVRNEAALRLYQQFGFVIEGLGQDAMRRLGQRLDVYFMARLLSKD